MISIWILLLTLAVGFPFCKGEFVPVIFGSAATPWSSSYDIKYGYSKEGEALTPDSCYHSKNKINQKAVLNIPWSQVTGVELLNRDQEYAGSTMGQAVYVCSNGGEDCTSCSPLYSSAGRGAWLPYYCPNTKGNGIAILHSTYYTIFCEVRITGTILHSGEFVPVIGGSAATPWSSSYDIKYGYSKEGEALTPDSCYHSKNKINQNAVLNIPWSEVTGVELLNRDNEYAGNTMGQAVYVCSNGGEDCTSCSPVYSSAGRGAWLPYSCPNTKGNGIAILHSTYYTIFCEVRITGTILHSESTSVSGGVTESPLPQESGEIETNTEKSTSERGVVTESSLPQENGETETNSEHDYIVVTGGTAATPRSSTEDLQHGYTREGQTLTPDTCYHSKYKNNQKAFLQIPMAEVRKVELLNTAYHNEARMTKGQVVYVCTDGAKGCKLCPTRYSSAGKEALLVYDCPEDTKGNTVLIYHPSYYTIFCEVWITGNKLID